MAKFKLEAVEITHPLNLLRLAVRLRLEVVALAKVTTLDMSDESPHSSNMLSLPVYEVQLLPESALYSSQPPP